MTVLHIAGEAALWAFFSLFLPAALPALTMAILRRFEKTDAAKFALHPAQAYKDGQLLWVSLTSCFIGLYEAGAAELARPNGLNLLLFGFLGTFVFLNAILLGKATGKSRPLAKVSEKRDYAMMSASIWLMVSTGVFCIAAHVRLMASAVPKHI